MIVQKFLVQGLKKRSLFHNKLNAPMMKKIIQVRAISINEEYKVMDESRLVIDKDRKGFAMYQFQQKQYL